MFINIQSNLSDFRTGMHLEFSPFFTSEARTAMSVRHQDHIFCLMGRFGKMGICHPLMKKLDRMMANGSTRLWWGVKVPKRRSWRSWTKSGGTTPLSLSKAIRFSSWRTTSANAACFWVWEKITLWSPVPLSKTFCTKKRETAKTDLATRKTNKIGKQNTKPNGCHQKESNYLRCPAIRWYQSTSEMVRHFGPIIKSIRLTWKK